mmetsp:Transcript_134157/g.428687  ORF Transcript_134157/g.428687 Transcript_134157/m.428687 type:complete len:113 (+) Transcript_134157:328-666(+)
MAKWSTGLCECCANPGGVGLCIRTSCCPCTVTGDINSTTKTCPCGFVGGCTCGCCCMPCFMLGATPKVMPDETGLRALCCSCMPCTSCCYLGQVYREIVLKKESSPSQMEMK